MALIHRSSRQSIRCLYKYNFSLKNVAYFSDKVELGTFIGSSKFQSKSKNNNDISQSSQSLTESDLETLLNNPQATITDILSIDARSLTSDVRITCLDSIFNIHSRKQVISERVNESPSLSVVGVNWPSRYLELEHKSRWADLNIGVNPFKNGSRGAEEAEAKWLDSDEFKLLLLSSAATANSLSIPRLLTLAGYFRYIWFKYHPKPFASVLHLLTNQLNEFTPFQLVQLIHITRDLPTTSIDSSLKDVIAETDILRACLAIHIKNKCNLIGSLSPLMLMRVLHDFGPYLQPSDIQVIFLGIESMLIQKPQDWNLYTIIYLLTICCKLKTFRPSLINRCLGQVRRKINVAHKFPDTNQSQWFNSVLAALANTSVAHQAPLTNDDYDTVENLQNFIRPVYQLSFDQMKHTKALDMHYLFTLDWVKQLFTDLSGHVDARMNDSHENMEIMSSEILYSLATLGYHATILSEHHKTQLVKPVEGSKHIELLSNLTHLLTSTSNLTESQISAIDALPRADWQFYCHLALQKDANSSQSLITLLPAYLSTKSVCHQLFDQIASSLSLYKRTKMKTFQFFNFSHDRTTYFTDILFEKVDTCHQGNKQYVGCFICFTRDYQVTGPLNRLLTSYADRQPIPFLTFNFSKWHKMNQQQYVDTFLHKVERNFKRYESHSPSVQVHYFASEKQMEM